MAAFNAPSLVGRSDELANLVDAVLDDDGDTAALLVGGDAGVGKSRLIHEMTALLTERGVTTVIGSCVHTAHSSLPFAAVTDAIARLRPHLDPDGLRDELEAIDVLDRLVPAGSRTPARPASDDVAANEAGDDDRSQRWMFEAVRQLFDGAARQHRVCVVLEDLHWADASTRDLLTYLATNLDAARVTVVGTYRSDDLSRTHPFRPVLAELMRHPRVRHLSLHPFDRIELAVFASARLGRSPSSRVLDDLLDRSGGNPFFATEFLDAIEHGDAGVRPEVSELVLGRIERLSEPARAVLRLLAVGGQSVPDELLGLVADDADDVLDEALREAVDHQVLVVVDGDRLEFRHALMQEVVHSTLLPRERRRAHARYAAALIEAPRLATCCGRHHAELAWHHREAGQLRESLLASIEAAEDSIAVLGLADALEHLETAIEVWEDVTDPEAATGTTLCDLLCRAAEVAWRSGDWRAARLQQAAIDESAGSPPAELGPMYERLGRFLWNSGRRDDAEAAYRRAVELVPPTPPSAERARVLSGLGQLLMLSFEVDEGVATLTEALDVARAIGERRIEGHALNSMGTLVFEGGQVDEGLRMLEESIAIAADADQFEDRVRGWNNLGSLLYQLGDLDGAERVCREGLELTDAEHDVSAFFISTNLCSVLVDAGRWDEALDLRRSVRRPDGEQADTLDLDFLPQLELRRGNVEAARELLDVELVTIEAIDRQARPGLCRGRAELAVADGDREAAMSAIEQGLAVTCPLHAELELRAMAVGLEAEAARNGDELALDRALAQLAALAARVPHVESTAHPAHRSVALHAQAVAHIASARGEDDVAHWRHVVERWERGGFPWHAASARCHLAEAHLRRGERDEARRELDRAVDAAEALTAGPLLDRARQLLRHAGLDEAGSRSAESGTGLLTDRESEVLRLVGEGRTNRQIGDELFISPKTVSVHVSRIFQKLGVENRTEAAATGRRTGLIT